MSKSGQGLVHVTCHRWAKTKDTPSGLPDTLLEAQVYDLPEPHGETYEECSGEIEVWFSYDEGQYTGPPENCYPAEEELEVHSCDTCGTDEWTDEEIKLICARVREGGASD